MMLYYIILDILYYFILYYIILYYIISYYMMLYYIILYGGRSKPHSGKFSGDVTLVIL